MILAGNWHHAPLPERPGSRDEADDRGFDPTSAHHDRVTPEPLDETWQAALDAANDAVRKLRKEARDAHED